MEHQDRSMIEELMKENQALKRLYERHRQLDEEVSRVERKSFLTTLEESELKRLKRAKLRGVDEMMKMVAAIAPKSAPRARSVRRSSSRRAVGADKGPGASLVHEREEQTQSL